MSRYERNFDTDWDDLDQETATEHAYAIGVAERLGEYNREHLEAIYDAMETSYERTMVELAYDEGRKEAVEVADDLDSGDAVWSSLVECAPTEIDPPEDELGGRDGLPAALDSSDVLDGFDADSTDVVDRPGFLDR